MRDLLFKYLTSREKKRRIISSTEVLDNRGVRSIIRRHFVYMVSEVKEADMEKVPSHIYVLRERNTKEQTQKFFCKMKGSLYAIHDEKIYLVRFMHSFKINLMALNQPLVR